MLTVRSLSIDSREDSL